jgi:LPPG:FO 2-phospho-L-lactate transferase
MRVVALTGGIGGSKLLVGLAREMNPRNLTIIVNTGDDVTMHGLEISPDIDIVTYTLAGIVNPATGWGFDGDTFFALDRLKILGAPGWFNLGDRDLATHIFRTEQLQKGMTLSQITEHARRALGVKARILPMSDAPVRTMLRTNRGMLNVQEYLVKLRAQPRVHSIFFRSLKKSRPAPGAIAAIRTAAIIVICPSNPLISVGPILAVPGIRNELRRQRSKVIVVSPIVGGKSLKGPSDRMLRQLGHSATALGVARLYRDICGTMILDRSDSALADRVRALKMRVVLSSTIMKTLDDKKRLARTVLSVAKGSVERQEKTAP